MEINYTIFHDIDRDFVIIHSLVPELFSIPLINMNTKVGKYERLWALIISVSSALTLTLSLPFNYILYGRQEATSRMNPSLVHVSAWSRSYNLISNPFTHIPIPIPPRSIDGFNLN